MTKQNYRKRIEALGYKPNDWAKECCVSRSTVFEHYKLEAAGEIDRIPSTFFVIIELLEEVVDLHDEIDNFMERANRLQSNH